MFSSKNSEQGIESQNWNARCLIHSSLPNPCLKEHITFSFFYFSALPHFSTAANYQQFQISSIIFLSTFCRPSQCKILNFLKPLTWSSPVSWWTRNITSKMHRSFFKRTDTKGIRHFGDVSTSFLLLLNSRPAP